MGWQVGSAATKESPLALKCFPGIETSAVASSATIDSPESSPLPGDRVIENRIDPTSPISLHEQVTGRLRRAIAEGEARPGERLPPARDLAAVLGVNSNTVLRAMRNLRDEGLLEFRRGRGVTVVGDAPPRGLLIARARDLVKLAQRQGYDREELIQLIDGLS